jgi:hypothetical protein
MQADRCWVLIALATIPLIIVTVVPAVLAAVANLRRSRSATGQARTDALFMTVRLSAIALFLAGVAIFG